MAPSAQNDKTPSPRRGKNNKKPNNDSDPLWERFAYGGGVTLVTVGPIWAGINAMTLMAIYMGFSVGIIILCCLLGAWKDLRSTTQAPRRIR